MTDKGFKIIILKPLSDQLVLSVICELNIEHFCWEAIRILVNIARQINSKPINKKLPVSLISHEQARGTVPPKIAALKL